MTSKELDEAIAYEKEHFETCKAAGFEVQARMDKIILESLKELKELKGAENEKDHRKINSGTRYHSRIHGMF